jgi:hypothetical protein
MPSPAQLSPLHPHDRLVSLDGVTAQHVCPGLLPPVTHAWQNVAVSPKSGDDTLDVTPLMSTSPSELCIPCSVRASCILSVMYLVEDVGATGHMELDVLRGAPLDPNIVVSTIHICREPNEVQSVEPVHTSGSALRQPACLSPSNADAFPAPTRSSAMVTQPGVVGTML